MKSNVIDKDSSFNVLYGVKISIVYLLFFMHIILKVALLADSMANIADRMM